MWRIERRLDARLRSDARARVMNNTVTKSRPDRAFFFLCSRSQTFERARRRKRRVSAQGPGSRRLGKVRPRIFLFFETESRYFHRDCFFGSAIGSSTDADRLRVRLTLSSKSPVSVRARADSHSCRARVHTETTMAFSIAASPRLGLERSLRQADGRKVARCVFRGPALGSTSSHKKPYATSY